ncbi:MAG: DUF4150 domain-containing protein [Deltaproteobacteria bacterium]|nr:DUF4150 domain-containing protein [Deltaproteobacteria bacterium]
MSQPTSTMEGGLCFMSPDLCVVPGVGVLPLANFAQCAEADITTTTRVVRIRNLPVLRLASIIPRSTGDEAGTGGGVVSGVFCGPTELLFSEPHVLFEGAPSVTFGCATLQNGKNGLGSQVSPSQTVVWIEPTP